MKTIVQVMIESSEPDYPLHAIAHALEKVAKDILNRAKSFDVDIPDNMNNEVMDSDDSGVYAKGFYSMIRLVEEDDLE